MKKSIPPTTPPWPKVVFLGVSLKIRQTAKMGKRALSAPRVWGRGWQKLDELGVVTLTDGAQPHKLDP